MNGKRYNRFVFILIAAIFMAGCAGDQKNLLVLLPSPDGHVGEAVISGSGGEKKLTRAYEAIGVDKPGASPSEPVIMDRKEVNRIFQAALGSQPEKPVIFLLYFHSNSSGLTDESAGLLPEIVAQIVKSASTDVSIVGHADRAGSRELNIQISAERARAVFDKLVSLGADPAIFEVTSHGMENPVVDTPEGVSEPKNRRVEVTVR